MCIDVGGMFKELWAIALVRAGVLGRGVARDTMWIIRVVALRCGVSSSTCSTTFDILALFTNMAVFLTFVAADRFLGVFNDNDSRICNKDSFCQQVICGDGG